MGIAVKVLWLCSVSNAEMREHYQTKAGPALRWIYKKFKHTTTDDKDHAQWDTNAIKEIEKRDDVELHVVCPKRFLTKKFVDFEMNGVYYHLFRDQNSALIPWLYSQTIAKFSSRYHRNRKRIKHIIQTIKPDIVHVIGAENPQYSLATLDIPESIPVIVQLQALLCSLENVTRIPFERKDYHYKGEIEKQIFRKVPFIGTTVPSFVEFIKKNINTKATILNTTLALTEPIYKGTDKKEYDFVYFSGNLSKGADLALKSFAIAHQKYPNITLDVIGGYTVELKSTLDGIVEEKQLKDSVTFEGFLPTHDDVIKQIRKAKYALLPITMDIIPGTVREAMANGIVVLTSITEGTPLLNSDIESVLLSPVCDYEKMAEDMIKVLENPDYANMLRENAWKIAEERNSNHEIIQKWVDAYNSCVSNFREGMPIFPEIVYYSPTTEHGN